MITASIVLYDTPAEQIDRLLECVDRSPIDKLYIIDHSPEKSYSAKKAKKVKTEYIVHDNLGYGSGHNVGLRNALAEGSDYHVVLNPDIYWTDPVIERIRDYMDSNPAVGQVMPKVLYPDGSVQHLCKLLPTPMDLFGRRFIPVKSIVRARDKRYEMQWSGYDAVMDVPSLSGCFMFLRCSTLKFIGLFDERFFLYAEDMDLCRRIGNVARTVFLPDVTIFHEYSKGSYSDGKLLKHHVSSIVKYFNKWGWFFDGERRKRNKLYVDRIKNRKGNERNSTGRR